VGVRVLPVLSDRDMTLKMECKGSSEFELSGFGVEKRVKGVQGCKGLRSEVKVGVKER
jgi:hypothetical protein